MTDYSFIFKQYPNSVCKSFTSSNFDIVSSSYDFANAPEHNACSSDERLKSVKAHRKSQVYYCSESNFSACSFYQPTVTFVKTFSLHKVDNNNLYHNIDVLKMKIRKEDDYLKDIYIICSISKQEIYLDFNSTGIEDSDMLICELFVKEAADNLKYKTDLLPVFEDQIPIVKKNSYFSKLMPTLATA